ncbi:hypothetical protein [Thalassococcus sp. S3]|uniref:hypothetical protein n=1 Tax=Thalassococcus sp. S3 TaxID=2017482 RepID=UPI00102435F7|nr:hypothetical protein [Thalassococcus sp. S3]QBF30742.1 hypothetical protein CFI11_05855 [Thalassococcus sp. S3]
MITLALAMSIGLSLPLAAQEADVEPPMTLERMGEIVSAIDPEARAFGTGFELTIDDVPLLIVTDPGADRMRAMVPIRSAEGLPADELLRLMQANFDTALDARYAVARGRLWGVFIHPLSPLKKDQLLSGLVQTINVAKTYGQSYSGGAQVFGGGDSNQIYRELLEELLKKGVDI